MLLSHADRYFAGLRTVSGFSPAPDVLERIVTPSDGMLFLLLAIVLVYTSWGLVRAWRARRPNMPTQSPNETDGASRGNAREQ